MCLTGLATTLCAVMFILIVLDGIYVALSSVVLLWRQQYGMGVDRYLWEVLGCFNMNRV